NRMADDPESWLDDMLQRTAIGEEGAAFDQMETFGRELLGEGAIEEWRPWFETQWARPLTTDLDPRDVPPSLVYQLDIPDDLPLRRVIDELDPEKLSMDARNRIQANLDVFDNPTVIFEKDMITAKGLRSVANRDTMIGNMLRRISDKMSPRAGIRRTGDLGNETASQVGQLAATKRAKEALVVDHVNRLGVTRQGASELWDASAREMGGDADLLSTLTDVL
ncbi:MAG: hypothetical protein GY937_23480, partial [bacterium]|nr:hypothetical protein [bacterium]